MRVHKHADLKGLEEQISERGLYLFRSLVERYIEAGQPVSSRALARDSGLDISPATVRNVMADLEDIGLIRSPHTSAGRIPTVKGYRLFVDSLLQLSDMESSKLQSISEEMQLETDAQQLLERTSSMLSRITRLAGVVTLPKSDSLTVRQVEFIPLSGDQVLMVLVMNDHEVQNRIFHTRRAFTLSELQEASGYLSDLLRLGSGLQAARGQLVREMRRTRDDINQLMQAVIEFAEQACRSREGNEDYVLAGGTNLMEIGDLGDVERIKRLFQTFEEKRDILHLLDEAIQAEGVRIFIGEESGYEVLDNCSVVASPYEVDGRVVGVLGVIGPTRMPYSEVIPVVDVTARMLSVALNFQP
ncbi:MAG: heat-inducible transcriptional repressor HrcA [Gammaproteobacteria bacterium]|nr:heat-inducible transcriptional repressor HrcA [Gammaproteobacteria bacterium]MDD9824565.1 heat-inducible transcriptional repressor HrcA [Gammaproteobacteria bacterium]MDD9864265.1 heat-inducible transcriptional repressor HrcA [Gammaproteobacteria bacterium]